MPDLVTKEEMQAKLGGGNTPEVIFMTALAMILDMNGGRFAYTQADLAAFRDLHGSFGQLGIQVDGDMITVFVYDAPVARA
jgi:hypothetical protein